MPQGKEFASAITIRLGILGASVLGAFAGHWIEMMSTPAGEVVLSWPTIAGAGAGLVTGWVTLTWFARRHRGAGVIAGSVLTIAAVVALLARFAWKHGG